jgi:hypothetical protein
MNWIADIIIGILHGGMEYPAGAAEGSGVNA